MSFVHNKYGETEMRTTIIDHAQYVREKTSHVALIVTRLRKNRIKHIGASAILLKESQRLRNVGRRSSSMFIEIHQEFDALSDVLRLDFETLYLHSTILLNQVIILCAYVVRESAPEKMTFVKIAQSISKGQYDTSLRKMLEPLSRQIIWLWSHLWAARNQLIVHRNQPWQVGASYTLDDEHFFITFSPSHKVENQKEIHDQIDKLLTMVPKSVWKNTIDGNACNFHSLLREAMAYIDEIDDHKTRKMIVDMAHKYGVASPSYLILSRMLLSFCAAAVASSHEHAINNLAHRVD